MSYRSITLKSAHEHFCRIASLPRPRPSPSAEAAAEPFDPLQLRRALGSFGTGVTVVEHAARPGGRLVGVTANSFSSVSLDPPIVLWSLNRRSPSLAAFDDCGRFVINVLALDQLALSRRFASPRPTSSTASPTTAAWRVCR